MSNTKYDSSLKVTKEDFNSADYENIIKDQNNYQSYWTKLSKQAQVEIESGNKEKGKVLWLLADICSFMLTSENTQEPYSPFIIMQGKRSAAPEDLTEEDIEFFAEIIEECNDFRLKARIGDILWLYSKKKNIKHLEIAIENFIQFPLDNDNLFRQDSKDSFSRAIKLALSTRRDTQTIETILLDTFNNTKQEEGLYCSHINDLIVELNIDINQNLFIIQKLEDFAQEFENQGSYWLARDYYNAAKNWFKKINSENDINRLTTLIAENFVKEAANRKDSQMAAANFYENAIQEYRSIPRKYRSTYNVDTRLSDIYQLMGTSNKLATDELSLIQTDPVDISPLITTAIERIENKDFEEAFVILSSITTTSNFEELRESSKKTLDSSVFSRLFGTTYYSGDGRVITKINGGLEQGGGEYEQQVEAQLQRYFSIDIGLSIRGSIYPAFEQFLSEHRVTKEYLMAVCLNSSIVPRDRASIWAEGLYFGFEKNFLVSTHLLIPQIEHIIRLLLKQAGVQTTVLEASGIEMEKGISTLIEDPKLEELIDRNLILELKYLLTKAIGYNLRNNVAHGLSTPHTFESIEAVYLWWRILRLVVQTSPLIELIKKIKQENEIIE
ncbi:DUF4209 domain-containing protein [Aliarcobacter butzleri]|uniref:DUF4209 domain-containing protein n=1 Tax=Aliarcobacter butzleri TaxID=28197 RepID=UPI0012F77F01|nr:DUF4209 domain-containing protein [Aliarcobacter butzleri]